MGPKFVISIGGIMLKAVALKRGFTVVGIVDQGVTSQKGRGIGSWEKGGG